MIMTSWAKERQEHNSPVTISIRTKVPSKWRFVDLETGDIWQWDEFKGKFVRAVVYQQD